MTTVDEYDLGGWRMTPLALRPVPDVESVIVRMDEPVRFGRYEISITSGVVHAYASLDYLEQGSDQYELISVITSYGLRVAALVKVPAKPGRTVAETAVMHHVGGPLWGMAVRVRGGEVICKSCRDQRHGKCRGGNWCDCQHRNTIQLGKEAASGGPVVRAE